MARILLAFVGLVLVCVVGSLLITGKLGLFSHNSSPIVGMWQNQWGSNDPVPWYSFSSDNTYIAYAPLGDAKGTYAITDTTHYHYLTLTDPRSGTNRFTFTKYADKFGSYLILHLINPSVDYGYRRIDPSKLPSPTVRSFLSTWLQVSLDGQSDTQDSLTFYLNGTLQDNNSGTVSTGYWKVLDQTHIRLSKNAGTAPPYTYKFIPQQYSYPLLSLTIFGHTAVYSR